MDIRLFNFCRIVLVCLGAMLVAGCGAEEIPKKVAKVIVDPKIQVGEPKDQPSTVFLTLYANPKSNINSGGEKVPIDIWIYQLTDNGKFLQSDFDTLTNEPRVALKSTYVDVSEMQIEPEDTKIIEEIELEKKTNYIGVVGGYLDLDKVDWRAVEQVKPKGENYKVLVAVQRRKIIISVKR